MLLRTLAGALGLLAAGCGDDGDEAASDSGASSAGQGLEGFFQPQKGESWTYRVHKELPLEVELSEEDQARRPERTDSAYVITFERVRTCTGTREIEGAGEVLTTMDIVEGGKRLGEELYDIGSQGVFFRGWLPAEDSPGTGLLEDGVKLVTPDLKPGQRWSSTGADPDRHFEFRVIERGEITVPAGTFEAVRIQITNGHRGTALKRTVWFAENIGIVKEEGVSYSTQQTRVRERSELVHFVVPSDPPLATEEPALTSADDPAGAGSTANPLPSSESSPGESPTDDESTTGATPNSGPSAGNGAGGAGGGS